VVRKTIRERDGGFQMFFELEWNWAPFVGPFHADKSLAGLLLRNYWGFLIFPINWLMYYD
jgi:hypothetical protein